MDAEVLTTKDAKVSEDQLSELRALRDIVVQ
jgi:hypothetical protein